MELIQANIAIWCKNTEAFLRRAPPGIGVICLQEHRLPMHKIDEVLNRIAAWGWQGHLAAAMPTENDDYSAGTGVLWRSFLHITKHIGSDHRVIENPRLAMVNWRLRGMDLTIGSAYLHDTTGATRENLELLCMIGEESAASGRPTIISAD